MATRTCASGNRTFKITLSGTVAGILAGTPAGSNSSWTVEHVYDKSLNCEIRVPMTDQLIRDYYRCFNERRIPDAGLLFTPDAVLEMPPFVQRAHGYAAYAQFAETWLRAFPDAVFTMERMEQHNETMCEVDIIATGTHSGPLDLGAFGLLKPSGGRLMLRLREVLDIRDGHIT